MIIIRKVIHTRAIVFRIKRIARKTLITNAHLNLKGKQSLNMCL